MEFSRRHRVDAPLQMMLAVGLLSQGNVNGYYKCKSMKYPVEVVRLETDLEMTGSAEVVKGI